jgi:hypothetical protein
MNKAEALKQSLEPGQVYRRAQLAQWSNAVDRHLKQLVDDGTLVKLSGGLYHYPKQTEFGRAPATDEELVRAFLKDDRFLIVSPNLYNALGVGTTQLYNETRVYNHKRHGQYSLGGRTFEFHLKPALPTTLNKAFLFVDLLNNLDHLAEDADVVKERIARQLRTVDFQALEEAVRYYGKVATKKFVSGHFPEAGLTYV